MRLLRFLWGLLFAGVLAPQHIALAQELRVLVVDALNGRPQVNVKVESFCIGPPRNFGGKRVFTDDQGVATFSNTCDDKQRIEFEVFPQNKKEQCGDDVQVDFNNAMSLGFISNPSSGGGIWCPDKVSKGLKPVPGQVTIFVKKPTWWQSHVAG